jgi:hypothetical protein
MNRDRECMPGHGFQTRLKDKNKGISALFQEVGEIQMSCELIPS